MASFLSEVRGFTPVIDVLVKKEGLVTACVYGVIWRYCQMETGVCTASLETIARHIGSSRKTVKRHAKKLVKSGYLTDLTPDLRYKPHTYADTGRVMINGLVEAGLSGETESPTSDDDRSDRESHQVRQRVPPGQTESLTRSDRESHKESIHDTSHETLEETGSANADSVPEPKHSPTPTQAIFEALAQTCAWNIDLLTDAQRGALNQTGGRLRRLKGQCITPADILAFGVWWTAQDWRGKRGDSPRPEQVRAEWGRFRRWQQQQAKAEAARADTLRQSEERRHAERRQAQAEAAADPDLVKARKVWAMACEELRGSMTQAAFATWIAPLVVVCPNGAFQLQAPTGEILEWVEHRLRLAIERALKGAAGRDVQVQFTKAEVTR